MAKTCGLTSAQVITGTQDASYWSVNLADNIKERRGCGIAIANETSFSLTEPHRYIFSGKVVGMPLEIPPNHTGLVKGVKTRFSLRGSVGVLTYQLQDPEYALRAKCYLQVMWHVPFDTLSFENLVNVRIGPEAASWELYQKLYDGDFGKPVASNHTSYIFHLDYQLQAIAIMGDTPKAGLSITFRYKPMVVNHSTGPRSYKINDVE